MFYAIPLENKPSWRNPPWMTLLLIFVNMVVFWGPQRAEELALDRAARFYMASTLPGLELPLFVRWLDDVGSPNAADAKELLADNQTAALLENMGHEPRFLARLQAGWVITSAHPQYAQWKQERRTYENLLPAPFAPRWSQSYDKEAEIRPVTWISNAFLHASTGHMLGNMVFLFLFGFTVELALGRALYLGFYLLGALGASLLAGWAYAGSGGYGLGASGAISALMGMYAVMYRLRRIRFFYQLFFYFNYVTAPAIILLPTWITNELLQHFIGGQGIAYMAHLGGLLSGALLMAGVLLFRKQALHGTQPATPMDGFDGHVASARQCASKLKFDAACVEWRAAAKLRPDDAGTLRSWFNTARMWPAGEDFHRAALLIFRLAPSDVATLELQHSSYKIYLDQAKPGARLKADDMARLAGRFTRVGQFNDAEKLCQALIKTAPEHTALGDTVCIFANGLLQAGQHERARQWLPHLQRLAPQDMVTRTLQRS
ncbi:MAG: rhomboid family intramembrane serine protease [Rhodoferax sp.]|nr:rhomboid family intramembrane serine protease [Rhodoferax sp.]MDP3650642.1 rhomboid family intramembrane serine protease [Rhodoferax sp.]